MQSHTCTRTIEHSRLFFRKTFARLSYRPLPCYAIIHPSSCCAETNTMKRRATWPVCKTNIWAHQPLSSAGTCSLLKVKSLLRLQTSQDCPHTWSLQATGCRLQKPALATIVSSASMGAQEKASRGMAEWERPLTNLSHGSDLQEVCGLLRLGCRPVLQQKILTAPPCVASCGCAAWPCGSALVGITTHSRVSDEIVSRMCGLAPRIGRPRRLEKMHFIMRCA